MKKKEKKRRGGFEYNIVKDVVVFDRALLGAVG